MTSLEKSLWAIFSISLTVTIINSLSLLTGHDISKNILIELVAYLGPILSMVLHSFDTLRSRGFFFIVLAALIGLFFEVIALQTGTVFGGHYIYKAGSLEILGVPWAVVAFWAVFIYTGYSLTNSFLIWLNKDKPNKALNNLWLIPPLVILDGLIVTSIDLLMDPIYVKAGAWSWTGGGPYYGVPIGNFIGWFEVTIVVTTIFRLFEYFSSPPKPSFNKLIFLIPVIGYGALGVSFASAAAHSGLSSLAASGLLPMLLWVSASLLVLANRHKFL